MELKFFSPLLVEYSKVSWINRFKCAHGTCRTLNKKDFGNLNKLIEFIETAQYNFILVRFEIFPVYLRIFCIYIFSIRKCVLTKWTVWKSVNIRGKMDKLQHRSALPNMKYNCAILFLNQRYWLFMYDAKYIFPQTSFVKPQSEIWETLAHVRII